MEDLVHHAVELRVVDSSRMQKRQFYSWTVYARYAGGKVELDNECRVDLNNRVSDK